LTAFPNLVRTRLDLHADYLSDDIDGSALRMENLRSLCLCLVDNRQAASMPPDWSDPLPRLFRKLVAPALEALQIYNGQRETRTWPHEAFMEFASGSNLSESLHHLYLDQIGRATEQQILELLRNLPSLNWILVDFSIYGGEDGIPSITPLILSALTTDPDTQLPLLPRLERLHLTLHGRY
jgi:hypothetical protein